jgi:hypothetical protein
MSTHRSLARTRSSGLERIGHGLRAPDPIIEARVVSKAPAIEEVEAFLAEYEAAREVPFTGPERRAIDDAAAYAMGYTARYGHQPGPEGDY